MNLYWARGSKVMGTSHDGGVVCGIRGWGWDGSLGQPSLMGPRASLPSDAHFPLAKAL